MMCLKYTSDHAQQQELVMVVEKGKKAAKVFISP